MNRTSGCMVVWRLALSPHSKRFKSQLWSFCVESTCSPLNVKLTGDSKLTPGVNGSSWLLVLQWTVNPSRECLAFFPDGSWDMLQPQHQTSHLSTMKWFSWSIFCLSCEAALNSKHVRGKLYRALLLKYLHLQLNSYLQITVWSDIFHCFLLVLLIHHCCIEYYCIINSCR